MWTRNSSLWLVISLVSSPPTAVALVHKLNNKNIKSAVDLWFSDEAEAQSKYGGLIQDWDTSKVTDMNYLFQGKFSLDDDLLSAITSSWNTEKVTTMAYMFAGASSIEGNFDGALMEGFVTSSVQNLEGMFNGASAFDGDLSAFDTSSVTSMAFMFNNAISFTGGDTLGGWDTSSVTNMAYMFAAASQMNANLADWETAKVERMDNMFLEATSFNGQLPWDTSSLLTTFRMFSGAISYSQALCWPYHAGAGMEAVVTEMFCGSQGSFLPTCSGFSLLYANADTGCIDDGVEQGDTDGEDVVPDDTASDEDGDTAVDVDDGSDGDDEGDGGEGDSEGVEDGDTEGTDNGDENTEDQNSDGSVNAIVGADGDVDSAATMVSRTTVGLVGTLCTLQFFL